MAGRLTKVGKAFYLFTMPGHPFPDSFVLTNSAWSYLHRADFLMGPNYSSTKLKLNENSFQRYIQMGVRGIYCRVSARKGVHVIQE